MSFGGSYILRDESVDLTRALQHLLDLGKIAKGQSVKLRGDSRERILEMKNNVMVNCIMLLAGQIRNKNQLLPQLVFIIEGFCFCRFAYLIKFICKPRISSVLLWSLPRVVTDWSHLMHSFQLTVNQGTRALSSYFISHALNSSFGGLISGIFFAFLLVILLFKMASEVQY